MQGRIFGIKKSYILTTLFVLVSALFVAFTLVSLFVFNVPNLWFFILCLSSGVYQLTKGIMFKFDSATYFGILLLSIGGSGFVAIFTSLAYFQSVFYLLSFAVASYFTFVFFNQKFHLYFSVLLYFATLSWFLVKIKIFSIPIFVAILVSSVLIFILAYTMINKISHRPKQKI